MAFQEIWYQTFLKYRIGADSNLGYNLFTSEEGEIIRPRKEPTTHLSVKTQTKENSQGEIKTFLRAKWGEIPQATRYNLIVKKLMGSLLQ